MTVSTSATSRLDVGAQVGLGEDDDRVGAALPGQRHVALDPADVQVLVERRDEEEHVDVGGDHLLGGLVPGLLSAEGRPAREDGLDGARSAPAGTVVRDPVADGGQVGGRVGGMAEPAADVGPHLALLAEEDVRAPVLDRDAAGAKAGVGVRLEGSARASPQPRDAMFTRDLLSRKGQRYGRRRADSAEEWCSKRSQLGAAPGGCSISRHHLSASFGRLRVTHTLAATAAQR